MDARIFENLAKKAAEWRSQLFCKQIAELFGVVAGQEQGICRVWASGGFVAEKTLFPKATIEQTACSRRVF